MGYLKKELYELVKSREDIFDFIQQDAPDGLWFLNLENQTDMWINQRFWDALGYSSAPEGSSFLAWQSIIQEENLGLVRERIKSMFEDRRESCELELKYWHSGGQLFIMRCKSIIIRNEQGVPLRMIGGQRDLTDARALETQTAIQNKRLKAILENLPDILFVIDSQGYYLDFFGLNHNTTIIPLDKIKGAHLSDLFSYEQTEEMVSTIQKVLSGEVIPEPYRYSMAVNGQKREYEARLAATGNSDEILAIIRDLTDEVKRENELKMLELVTSSALDSIIVSDRHGLVVWVNEGFKRLTGYSIEEVLGKQPKMFLQGPETDVETKQKMGDAIRNFEPFRGEIINYNKAGNQYWIELNITPVFNEKNECEGFISVGRDISSRKKSEEELRHAKELLTQSSEVGKIGGWQFDFTTNKMEWTENTYRLFGLDPKTFEVTADSAFGLIHPDDQQRANDVFQVAVKQGIPYQIEKRFLKSDGSYLDVHSIAKIDYDKQGSPHKLFGVFQNITDKKQKDKELHFQAKLLDQVGQAVICTDAEGKVIYWNLKATELYGWKKEEVIGRSILEITPSDQSVAEAEKVMEELISGKTWSGEFSVKRKDGSQFPASVVNVPVFSDTGKLEAIIGISEDITQRRKAENELIRTRELLEQTNMAARVGGWEIDLENKTFYWSQITREIHEIDSDPIENMTFEEGMNFRLQYYREGTSRTRIKEVSKLAMEQGKPFDEEFEMLTAKGRKIWVRVIGKPELKQGVCTKLFGAIYDITDIKQAQEDLRVQQQKLDYIITGSQIGTWEWNHAEDLWIVNDQWLKIHGLERNEANKIDEHFLRSRIHPDDEPFVRETVEKHIGGLTSFFESEFRVKHATKGWAWVLLRGRIASYLPDGRPEWIYGVLQEITSIKLLEVQIRENYEKFRNIFELSPVGISLNDFHTGMFMEANDALLNDTGYSREELLKLTFKDITPNEYLEQEKRKAEALLRTGRFGPYEKEFIRHDGSRYSVLVNCLYYTDQHGREFTLTTNQDISEQKRLIQFLEIQKQQISKDAKYYKSLLENNSFFLVKTDLEGRYTFLNHYFCKQMGIQESEWLGKSADEFIDANDLIALKNTLEQCFEHPGISHWVSLKKQLGDRLVHIQWEVILLTNSEGQPSEIIKIGHDISSLMQKQEELQALVDITAEQNKRLMQFTHIVSHNLRSHVANLSSILSVTDIKDPNDLELSWLLIDKTTHALDETLHNLNEVVSIQSNTNIPYREIPVLEGIQKTIDSLHQIIENTDATIETFIEPNATIYAIPAYLDSIMLNFLSNAIKYRHPERNPNIEISLIQQADSHILVFKDNGLGLDLERYRDRLFGMYKTFHGNKDAKGLGLFITKAQVEAMKGFIEVESTVNEGTSFKIHFPTREFIEKSDFRKIQMN